MWICIFRGYCCAAVICFCRLSVLIDLGQTRYFFLQGRSHWWLLLSVMQCFKYLQLERNCLNRAEAGNKSRLENIGPVQTGGEEFVFASSRELLLLIYQLSFRQKYGYSVPVTGPRVSVRRLVQSPSSLWLNLYKMEGRMCAAVGDLT